jgi:hypothetical protein
MRRLAIVLAVFCVVLVGASIALAKTQQDSAFGTGVRAPSGPSSPAGTFSFNTTSGTNGENASGTFVADFAGYASFTGAVTCLHVSGNTATLFGQISSGTGAADPSTYASPVYFVAVVNDNGKAKNKAPSPDQMSLVGWDTEANFADSGQYPPSGLTLAQVCANPTAVLGTDMFSLVSGDLTVIDK